MFKKTLNKVRYPFLQLSFPENPLPFKRLNRKAVRLNAISNRKGLTNRIKRIQKNIIEQQTIIKKKATESTHKKNTVESVNVLQNYRECFSFLKYTKKIEQDKKEYSRLSKYMFSLEQLKAEFYKKQSGHSKSSVFKTLLEERKKCSIVYGCLNKKQIHKLFLQAKRMNGKFDENFIKIVESRLDVTLFRVCFFPTIFSARQWVSHGHILVNNSVITLPGYQLKSGDIVTITPNKRKVVKQKLSLFIADKIKIRSTHYSLGISTFYTLLKSCVFRQNKNNFLETNIKENTKKSFFNLFLKQKEVFKKKKKERIKSVSKNKIFSLFYLVPKIFAFFSKKKQQLLPFLKIRNHFTSARPLKQRVAGFKISGMKPLNTEVCYKNMVAIFLYSPQKVALPASIDLQLIAKTI